MSSWSPDPQLETSQISLDLQQPPEASCPLGIVSVGADAPLDPDESLAPSHPEVSKTELLAFYPENRFSCNPLAAFPPENEESFLTFPCVSNAAFHEPLGNQNSYRSPLKIPGFWIGRIRALGYLD